MRKTGFGRTVGVAGAMILSGMLLVACEKKKPPPPPPPPPPKPVVKTPDPVDINGIMSTLKPDGRVQFTQANAPADRTLAEATVRLASAIAKGDSKALSAMLDPGAKAILEDLVSSGGWADSTKKIEQVRVISVSSKMDEKASQSDVTLAIQVPGQAFLLAWSGTRVGDGWVFKNAWADGAMKTRASEFDGSATSDGASASGAASAGGGLDDDKKLGVYLYSEILNELAKTSGSEKPTKERFHRAMKLMLPNTSDAEIDEALVRGKEIVDSGDALRRAKPREIYEFVDGDFSQTLVNLGVKTREERIAIVARVFKVSPEEIAKVVESGKNGGSAPSPSSKGGTPPEKPKAADPDTIKKNTPVGPVTIPKGRRPGGGDN